MGLISGRVAMEASGSNKHDYIVPGLMETELAVLIFRRASSLEVSPCRWYGVDSRQLGRAESSETFCREGKVGLNASSLFLVSFSCANCERLIVNKGSTERIGEVEGSLGVTSRYKSMATS